jgi:integrase
MAEKGTLRLFVKPLYGTGMRISECCQLRVWDVDFDRGQIVIRGGKGNRNRATMLPRSLEERWFARCRDLTGSVRGRCGLGFDR